MIRGVSCVPYVWTTVLTVLTDVSDQEVMDHSGSYGPFETTGMAEFNTATTFSTSTDMLLS